MDIMNKKTTLRCMHHPRRRITVNLLEAVQRSKPHRRKRVENAIVNLDISEKKLENEKNERAGHIHNPLPQH